MTDFGTKEANCPVSAIGVQLELESNPGSVSVDKVLFVTGSSSHGVDKDEFADSQTMPQFSTLIVQL